MVNLTKLTIIKLLELILVIVLIVLHYDVGVTGYHNQFLTTTAFGGYLIILIGVVAGVTTGTPINRRIDLYFTLVGAVLFIISGILILDNKGSNHLPRAILAIVEGVLFIIDAIFTFRGEA